MTSQNNEFKIYRSFAQKMIHFIFSAYIFIFFLDIREIFSGWVLIIITVVTLYWLIRDLISLFLKKVILETTPEGLIILKGRKKRQIPWMDIQKIELTEKYGYPVIVVFPKEHYQTKFTVSPQVTDIKSTELIAEIVRKRAEYMDAEKA
ncbi:hypothetical protein [Listeria costaricensis]|uniref:hypothetical protein n=1 Tax=Listeria costaricensis TaxID=2026604 RepID=UPI000C07304B|nr:hypothetical protein [Listeria costaricensis]